MTTTRACPKCKTTNLKHAKHCWSCGTRLAVSRWKVLLLIVLALTAVVMLAEAMMTPEERAARERERIAAATAQHQRDADAAVARERLQADAAAALERRKTEDAAAARACRSDLSCWSEKHAGRASLACRTAIERLAKYEFEWTNAWLDPIFTKSRWKNQAAGHITYAGDRIKLQNGFGAWAIHSYRCDYSTETGGVLDVEVAPGRL